MDAEPHRRWLLTVGALAGYAVLMATHPARPSLRDGLRCVRRYPQVWLLPAGFALAHAAFRLWRHELEAWLIAGKADTLLPWGGWQPPPWSETLSASWLPALESTAAIFNCVTTTFPLSALAGLLFLGNWRDYQADVFRAMRRRFGRVGGGTIHLCLAICACAAVCKPVLFGSLPRFNGFAGAGTLVRVGEIVDSLSFVFEYGLGVGVQIYLVLLCFAWVRGLTFDFDGLRRFALRRFAFVFKWAGLVIVVSGLGINGPLVLNSFQSSPDLLAPNWTTWVIHGTRWLLGGVLLLFCSMQILLIFKNELLRRAVHDHFRLLRRHGGYVVWLLVIVGLHFFVLALLDAFVPLAAGAWTWTGATWSLLIYPLLWTALAGWFLASWVCLFKRCEKDRPDLDELALF